ncbi:hypothetical protein EVAR_98469_1 [Eumeta japonica]|uniref:Uncharacterized protein n=1 Tax=Eumeta variegata TaxID=151549 RepID=A0A4C1YU04_EUMVA|nr:hypothetical protein EVAR_98469_1 [Eumeta japonica]
MPDSAIIYRSKLETRIARAKNNRYIFWYEPNANRQLIIAVEDQIGYKNKALLSVLIGIELTPGALDRRPETHTTGVDRESVVRNDGRASVTEDAFLDHIMYVM